MGARRYSSPSQSEQKFVGSWVFAANGGLARVEREADERADAEVAAINERASPVDELDMDAEIDVSEFLA